MGPGPRWRALRVSSGRCPAPFVLAEFSGPGRRCAAGSWPRAGRHGYAAGRSTVQL